MRRANTSLLGAGRSGLTNASGGNRRVEDQLAGAVETEIGRLADAVFDPHVSAFPEEIPHLPRGELQLQHVAGGPGRETEIVMVSP